MQHSVDQKTLSPHRALDRVPKMDKLKEVYLRLNDLGEFLENKALPDRIFEYINFPSSQILEGTSKFQEMNNLTSKKFMNSIQEMKSDDDKADKPILRSETKVIDLNRLVLQSTETLQGGLVTGNKQILSDNEFKLMTKTLKQLTITRKERAENLRNLHKKLLDYISKVPYS